MAEPAVKDEHVIGVGGSKDFNVGEFMGVLNNESQKKLHFTRNKNLSYVESEVNQVTYVYNYTEADISERSNQEMLSHIKDIKQSFETLYSSEMAWLKPLPWITDLEFEPEEFYVELQLEELSRGGKLSKKESMKVEELLKPEHGYTKPPKRVLVRGEAGLGKTTTCLKIAYDWSKGKEGNLAESFELLLLFRLRDLLQNESPEKGLLQFCHVNASKEVEDTYTVEALRKVADKILIILDGYDELSTCHRNSLHSILKAKKEGFQSVFRNSTIVVTSRVTEDETFLKLFQKHVRIVGLSEEAKIQIVKNMFPYDEDRSSAILKNINKYYLNFSSTATPFILYLICFLYQNKKDAKESKSPSMVLRDVLLLMGRKTCERLGIEMTESDMEHLYRKLGEFCVNKDQNESVLLFSKTDINNIFPDENRRKFILDCGIFRAIKSLRKSWMLKDVIEPVHKLFVDYVSINFLQHGFDFASTLDEKISFIFMTTYKGESFTLLSSNSNVVNFYTETVRARGIQFVCSWEKDVEDPEKQIENGKFFVTDDEAYTLLTKEFENVYVNCGFIAMYLTDYQPFRTHAVERTDNETTSTDLTRSGFAASKKLFSPYIKGRNLISKLLESSLISNEILLQLADIEYDRDETGKYILGVRALENGSPIWSARIHFNNIRFYPEDWLKREDKDYISIQSNFCYRIKNSDEFPVVEQETEQISSSNDTVVTEDPEPSTSKMLSFPESSSDPEPSTSQAASFSESSGDPEPSTSNVLSFAKSSGDPKPSISEVTPFTELSTDPKTSTSEVTSFPD